MGMEIAYSSVLHFREGDAEESLGSPSDPSFSPVSWSISGKYLAGALEKMVNIWQVNGKSLATAMGAAQPPSHLVLEALASLYLEIHELFYEIGRAHV